MALSKATRRLLIILAVLLGLLVVIGVGGRALGLFKQEAGIEVEVAKAERRDITQVVTASGRVQPEVEVTISPDVSGEIVELPVREGDRVEKGQLLARIRPDFYEAQVQQAEAGVAQARATLKQREADLLRAEAEYKRQKALYEKQAISPATSRRRVRSTRWQKPRSRPRATPSRARRRSFAKPASNWPKPSSTRP